MGTEITDYIKLVGTTTEVEFTPNDIDWIKGIVVGVSLPEQMVCIRPTYKEASPNEYKWFDLYFRLNENHPKNFKIRIPNGNFKPTFPKEPKFADVIIVLS